MKVFITGGTGFIGQKIVDALLARGEELVVLTRDRARARALWQERVEVVEGDPCFAGPWQASIRGCDAVINLAGEPLDGARWDARFRQRLHDSRVDSTRFTAEAIVACAERERPEILISASGIDYYGFAEVELFDDDEVNERDPGGESFLAALCWDWEDETRICEEAGVRVALMRTGLVLGKKGALAKLAGPFRRGLGGRIGCGRQWMSWIHIADAVSAYLFVLDQDLSGPVNLAAPGNVRNSEFAEVLARVLSRRAWLPVPAFALRAVAGQLGEYLLKGRRVVPEVLSEAGFDFEFPELESALRDLLAR